MFKWQLKMIALAFFVKEKGALCLSTHVSSLLKQVLIYTWATTGIVLAALLKSPTQWLFTIGFNMLSLELCCPQMCILYVKYLYLYV